MIILKSRADGQGGHLSVPTILTLLSRIVVGAVLLYSGFMKAVGPSAEFSAAISAYKILPPAFVGPLFWDEARLDVASLLRLKPTIAGFLRFIGHPLRAGSLKRYAKAYDEISAPERDFPLGGHIGDDLVVLGQPGVEAPIVVVVIGERTQDGDHAARQDCVGDRAQRGAEIGPCSKSGRPY